MTSDPVALMLFIVALCVLICVMVLGLPDCLEDCAICKRIKSDRDDQIRKRQEDYWNGRRPRP